MHRTFDGSFASKIPFHSYGSASCRMWVVRCIPSQKSELGELGRCYAYAVSEKPNLKMWYRASALLHPLRDEILHVALNVGRFSSAIQYFSIKALIWLQARLPFCVFGALTVKMTGKGWRSVDAVCCNADHERWAALVGRHGFQNSANAFSTLHCRTVDGFVYSGSCFSNSAILKDLFRMRQCCRRRESNERRSGRSSGLLVLFCGTV